VILLRARYKYNNIYITAVKI